MAAIQTPCVNFCALNQATGLCTGCGRTLAEIATWSSLSDGERDAIMRVLPTRMDAARRTIQAAQ